MVWGAFSFGMLLGLMLFGNSSDVICRRQAVDAMCLQYGGSPWGATGVVIGEVNGFEVECNGPPNGTVNVSWVNVSLVDLGNLTIP
jgi:hypothetical protein